MRVVVVHNTYRGPGGEDIVARMEATLLRTHGHEVKEYWRSNAELHGIGSGLRASVQALWARDTLRAVSGLIRSFRPHVIHVHNTWIMVSPAVYWAAKRYRIPVVQTLHNFRLLCPNAQFLRNGGPCERCKTLPFAWPGVVFACYRGSRSHSLLAAGTVATHRLLGTWQRRINMYVALTHFARWKFIEGGIPPDRVTVKPNFVHPDPGLRKGVGAYALYAGRLSSEKGVLTVLDAWQNLSDVPLIVAGKGPLLTELKGRAGGLPYAQFVGWRDRERVVELMKSSRMLIFPSECYEGFPLAIAEAFACGVPVVASRLGAMAEIVHDGETGLHFTPGDSTDLAAKVKWLWTQPGEVRRLGCGARADYEANYTAGRNYHMLMEIYERVVDSRAAVSQI